MTLTEKHDALVVELGELKINFQALAARLGGSTEAQRAVDAVGVKLIALEHSSGIADARHLVAHATVADDLPMFQEMVEKYSAPVDWTKEIQVGNVAAEDVEARIAERAHILSEAKKSVTTLTRLRNEASQRRKKFPAEVLSIASDPDPLTGLERANFERLYIDTRAERATNSVFDKILKPLELATA